MNEGNGVVTATTIDMGPVTVPATPVVAPDVPDEDLAGLPENVAKSMKDMRAEITKLQQAAAAKTAAATLPSDAVDPVTPAAADPAVVKTEADAAAADLAAKGVDVDAIAARFWESGELADADIEAITKANPAITRERLTEFAAGQKAVATLAQNELLGDIGGTTGFDAAKAWATGEGGWSNDQRASFNNIMKGTDTGAKKMALSQLNASFKAANGTDPTVNLTGKNGGSVGAVYASSAQMEADMRDPRYQVDPAFRQQVSDKLARSNF